MAKEIDKQVQWSNDYNKKNTKTVLLRLNMNYDQDIIEYLEASNNKQGEIKRLIREEMQRNHSK